VPLARRIPKPGGSIIWILHLIRLRHGTPLASCRTNTKGLRRRDMSRRERIDDAKPPDDNLGGFFTRSAYVPKSRPKPAANIPSVAAAASTLRPAEPPRSGFNWWALFFGPFWYFYKNLWGKGLVLILAAMIAAFVTLAVGGLGSALIWIWAATKANEDYYVYWRGRQRALGNLPDSTTTP